MKSFYDRQEWHHLRYRAFVRDGFKCLACGATRANGAELHGDHIKPISIYPELALTPDNIQTLCKACNLGKSNIFDHDFRPKFKKYENQALALSILNRACIECFEQNREKIRARKNPRTGSPMIMCDGCWEKAGKAQ